MLNFIKRYWFVVFITIFVLLYLVVFLLVLASPRQDDLNRGFIPCTQKMAQEILINEEKSSLKLAKIIIANTYCDTKVVFSGLTDWIKGKQKTPWANYLFEPQVYKPIDATDEELLKFYQEHPNINKEMEELDKQRIKLEQMLLQDEVVEEANFPTEEVVEEENKQEEKEEKDGTNQEEIKSE